MLGGEPFQLDNGLISVLLVRGSLVFRGEDLQVVDEDNRRSAGDPYMLFDLLGHFRHTESTNAFKDPHMLAGSFPIGLESLVK